MKDGKIDLKDRVFRVMHDGNVITMLKKSAIRSIVGCAFGENELIVAECSDGTSFSVPSYAVVPIVEKMEDPYTLEEGLEVMEVFLDSVVEDFLVNFGSPGLLVMPICPEHELADGTSRVTDIIRNILGRALTRAAIGAGWAVFAFEREDLLSACPWCGRDDSLHLAGGMFVCGCCDAGSPVEEALVRACLSEAEEIYGMGEVPVGESRLVHPFDEDATFLEIASGVTCVIFGDEDYCAVSRTGYADEWIVYGKRMRGLISRSAGTVHGGGGEETDIDPGKELSMLNEEIAEKITDVRDFPCILAVGSAGCDAAISDQSYEKYRAELGELIVKHAERRGIHVMRVNLTDGSLYCPECFTMSQNDGSCLNGLHECPNCGIVSRPDQWKMATVRMICERTASSITGIPGALVMDVP